MVQMWLLWWPKTTANTSATAKLGCSTSTTISTATSAPQNGSSNVSNCCCSSRRKTLSKLVKKLKKHGGKMLRAGLGSKQSSFQCRYDPLSYSLNFDTSGSGSLLDDEDYYYKFSSRFVANRRPSSSPRVQPTPLYDSTLSDLSAISTRVDV